MKIYYVARRSIITGHVVDTEYVLDVATLATNFSARVEKVTQRAIGGATETLYARTDRTWQINFEPLRGVRLANLKEFLESTERGETFRMTLPGDTTVGTLCRRTDDGYSLAEYMPLGDNDLDWFQASCSVIEI
jgi:hypothetical protein